MKERQAEGNRFKSIGVSCQYNVVETTNALRAAISFFPRFRRSKPFLPVPSRGYGRDSGAGQREDTVKP